jgi:hypothetical protein
MNEYVALIRDMNFALRACGEMSAASSGTVASGRLRLDARLMPGSSGASREWSAHADRDVGSLRQTRQRAGTLREDF